MNIVHISDLHLCNKYKQKNIKSTEKLLLDLHKRNIDHLIISGDISEQASPEDLMIFRDLLIKYDFYDTKKTSLVPGNHDIYGGVHLAADIVTFPQKCRDTDYHKKIELFYNIFSDLFEKSIQSNKNYPFPYAKDLGQVFIIGLDTNMKYSYWGNPLASNGRVSREQLHNLEILLGKPAIANKPKIVISHHHLFNHSIDEERKGFFLWQIIEQMTMLMHNRRQLLKLLKKFQVDMVVHGHIHTNYLVRKKGITFANGGGFLESDFKNDKSMINIISLNKNQLDVRTEDVQLKEPANAFVLYKDLKPGFVA